MADFQDFITHNRAAFNQLLTFIDFAAERLTIAFVSVNFAPDRSAIIEAIQAHPTCADIQLLVLDFGDREVQFLQQALLERLAGIERVPGKKRVLLLTGLERSIGMSGDYPPLLRDLNFVRDGFGEKVPDPMVLFLPDYSITRLARFAPDFWAWELGVFKFETLPQRVRENYAYTLESERIRESLDLGERREQVDLLQRLLMEYDPQGKPESVADRRARAAIYNELGVLYRNLGEVQRAEDAFTQGFGLTSRTEADLVKLRGLILHEWGYLKANTGEVDHALKLYQEALEIREETGHLAGKAATLHCLGILKANQGDIQGAIDLYQQSLQLKEQIGNIQGKAATLHCLGSLKADQGDIQGAIDLYQQSLQTWEQIGNIQGKAATLHCLGMLKANQGDIQGAIDLYQQSLQLQEQIGDIQGKAATLHQLAILKANQGDIQGAIDLYQQSIEIEEQIGNIQGKAITLGMMAQLLAFHLGEVDQAIEYFTESVSILQQIGSPIAQQVQADLDRVRRMKSP